jgi:DNA replication protein DnaC
MSLDNIDIQLKHLRLSGLRETLEQRLQQAQENHLSHRELLNLILQDELQYREAKALARRLAQAQFEEEKTLEGLQMSFYPVKIQQLIRNLICGQYLMNHQHILVMGPTELAT